MSTNSSNTIQALGLWLARNITNSASFNAHFEPIVQLFLPQWRADRFRSEVVEIRNESADMYSLVIKPNKNWTGFNAGQYLELIVEKEGSWVSRFFSISSSPTYFEQSGLIEISIRIQEKGQITPWLPQALEAGSVLNISEAQGHFVLNQNPKAKPTLMIAGGSGITPFRSMLQQIGLNGQSIKSPVTLMYYARSSEHFLFRTELQQFEKQVPNLEVHFIDTDDVGFFSDAHLFGFCQDFDTRDIYICGPSPMILHARKVLKGQKVSDDQVHYEFFGPEPVSLDVSDKSVNVLFQDSGKQVSTKNTESKTLLDLAEGAALKPVTGCRIGVCHQCICKKESGVVYNSKTKTYSDTGQEEIQLCVSVPVADVVLAL